MNLLIEFSGVLADFSRLQTVKENSRERKVTDWDVFDPKKQADLNKLPRVDGLPY